MAQYGKNYYGASYYGLSGVFAGQFTSDQTNLNTPLTNVAPSNGKLYVDLICAHPRITYTYPNDIYIRTGTWTDGTTISSSDAAFSLKASLVASTIYLNYIARVDGSDIDIEVKTYVAGVLVDTQTLTTSTTGASPYTIEPLQYGEQVITITKNALADPTDVFEFQSLTAMTTDLKLEVRPKNSDDTWGDWVNLALTATESNVDYNGFSNVYKYSAETADWTGCKGYQFKLMLASSDNTNTPEIISADIHTVSTSDYAPAGFWKMTMYIPETVNTLDSVVFNVTEPDDTDVDIRSRTSDIDGSWSSWSLPYTAATYRAILNYKSAPSTTSGYIITPVLEPANLTTWSNFQLSHFLNYIDTFSSALTPGSSIVVEVVKETYNALNPATIDVLRTFTYTDMTQALSNIEGISVPIRIKVNFTRTIAVASPAIENVNANSNAYYSESKIFGTGTPDLKGYGSTVFNGNTGVSNVYTDGLTMSVQALISNLSFTVPAGATNPEYKIEVDSTFASTYTAEEVDIYWHSNNTKSVYLEGALTDDYIVVAVKEASEINRIRNHYRYGSGIVLSLDPQYTTISLANSFSPMLVAGRTYAFYLKNGFLLEDPNTALDIRWNTENSTPVVDRKNIAYSLNDKIYIGITTGSLYGLVDWVSEEKKIDGTVNLNDIHAKYSATITDLPEMDSGVIVDPNPEVIPYQVEVIEGSVISRGERKDETLLTGSVRYLYASDQTPSLVESIEEKAAVVRGTGDKDYLPKALIKSVDGVYSAANQYSPYYIAGTDYDYAIPAGSTYSNEIDWTKGIVAETAPAAGTTYYVSYTYDKVVALRVEFTCDYKEYEPVLQIFRSDVIQGTGECSPVFDYISPTQFDFDDFTIPSDVDASTLRLVVYDTNARVRTYVEDGRVVGTMDNRDPRESWNPYVRGGRYYINKDSYYMFTSEKGYSLGAGLIPIAENISYETGVNGSGVLIEEGTTNILTNTDLSKLSTTTNVFTDTFTRT